MKQQIPLDHREAIADHALAELDPDFAEELGIRTTGEPGSVTHLPGTGLLVTGPFIIKSNTVDGGSLPITTVESRRAAQPLARQSGFR